MGIIDEIIGKRRIRLAKAMREASLDEVRRAAEAMPPALDFRSAITRKEAKGPIRLIAELKKASPSRGLIRPEFDPSEVARAYSSRASALSVLTEEDYFQGRLEYIAKARAAAPALPILRKDFIVHEYQVYEARAAGADAILLICMALDDKLASDLLCLAGELGLAVLFEVHDRDELKRAIKLGAPIIGINNRDLRSLSTRLDTTFELLADIPKGRTVVSESGIATRDDVKKLEKAGVDAMLIGTAFMKAKNISSKVDELMGAA